MDERNKETKREREKEKKWKRREGERKSITKKRSLFSDPKKNIFNSQIKLGSQSFDRI